MRFLWFGLVAFATFGCHESAAPASAGDVRLTLALSATNLRRLADDTIRMTVRNIGPRRVSLTGAFCEPRAQVLNSAGEIVEPPGGEASCVRSLRRLELEPGQAFESSFVWNTASIPPGIYHVSASFVSEEVQLVTETVAVEIN